MDEVERMARAIEGPHFPVPEGSKYTLDELRAHRWAGLTTQKRGERMTQARAALAEVSR